MNPRTATGRKVVAIHGASFLDDVLGIEQEAAALVRTPETLVVERLALERIASSFIPEATYHGSEVAGRIRAALASPAPDPGAAELCPECTGTGYVRHSGDFHFRVAPSAEPPETGA